MNVLTLSSLILFATGAPAASEPQQSAAAWVSVGLRESLLARVANQLTRRGDAVNTTILGAAVRGCQTTTTDSRIDLRPCDTYARLQVVNRGEVQSDTISTKPSVWIAGDGRHSFEIIKPVRFDGRRFLTQPAWGTIRAREAPRVVRSQFTQVPLLGPFADSIARAEVFRRLPETNQAVAADVARDVLDQVNRDVDARLADLNRQLLAVTRVVESQTAIPELTWTATSSDDALYLHSGADRREPGTPRAATMLSMSPSEDMVVVVSEGLVNSIVARLIPQDVVLSDSQLLAAQTELRPSLLDWNTVRTLKPPADSGTMLFGVGLPGPNAVRVAFESGQIRTQLQGRIVPRIGSPGDWLTTELSLSGESATDDHFVLRVRRTDDNDRPSDSSLLTAGSASGTAMSTVRAGLVEALDGLRVTRWVELPPEIGLAERLQLSQIDCAEGLMRLSFRLRSNDASPGK